MDIKPQQPISDDQELAKVLAGITAGADQSPDDLANNLEQEAASVATTSTDDNVPMPPTDSDGAQVPVTVTSTPDPMAEPAAMDPMPVEPAAVSMPADSGLELIKNSALNELRPLVDKLNVSPEEKFDTYLLLIRSTDDSSLIGPAFEAARGISDETGKAQALLDIVKEIDYLSNPQKQTV